MGSLMICLCLLLALSSSIFRPVHAYNGCTPPDGWCVSVEMEDVFRVLDCDGDGLLDLTCVNKLGNRYALLTTRNCTGDFAGSAPANVCPRVFAVPPPPPPSPPPPPTFTGCTPPDGWCVSVEMEDLFRVLDCDGDGRLDLTCVNKLGNRYALLTTRNCTGDFAGSAPVTICPRAFAGPPPPPPTPPPPPPPRFTGCKIPSGWCVNPDMGDVLRVLDCDGDGLLDLTCVNKLGNRWALLTTTNCDGDFGGSAPADVCPRVFAVPPPPPPSPPPSPTFTGCTPPDGWCVNPDMGDVFRVLDCDGDGRLDLTCVNYLGNRYALLTTRNCTGDFAGSELRSVPMHRGLFFNGVYTVPAILMMYPHAVATDHAPQCNCVCAAWGYQMQ
ncbi:hypothetical protein VOLCADRAFT_96733 [Volvox carteri f. nagariensis]|uniref:EF-hand domain-containing protein n=1 Tax=Volvox carteri f. nagariensis TaxID=3068 RepID=D8UAW8_VOLCA|nr:uncharacterized protein VOLCADRAFT_96733 [Volvox carteri f. nagariensis]EFJ43229.1 hypothetical protein VOLCADRAFT_96733 [Volvox carteri f. nagariensis]|eukprot:XP_002955804.1 hypothetical protein VOLCADRAFT_96733 [Volvox carteri f. nagariensis]